MRILVALLLLPLVSAPLAAGWSAEAEVSSAAGRDQLFPAVVATATGYLAAWEEREGFGSRVVVAPLGSAVQQEPFPIASSAIHQVEPALASADDVVVVMWLESDSIQGLMARAQRFTAGGVPLGSEPVTLGESVHVSYEYERVAAVWSGRYFLLAWAGREGLRFVRMTKEGILLDTEPRAVPQSERVRSLPYPATALYQLEPAFARTGGHLFLVFQSSWDSGCVITCPAPRPPARIEGVRLDAEGNVLDAEPIVFSEGNRLGETHPEVASDGEGFVVLWGVASAFVYGSRVSVDGVVDPIVGLDTFFARVEDLATSRDRVILLTLETGFDGGRDVVMRMISSSGSVGPPQLLASGVAPHRSLSKPVREVAVATRDDGGLVVIVGRVDPAPEPILRLWYRTFEPSLRRRAAVRR